MILYKFQLVYLLHLTEILELGGDLLFFTNTLAVSLARAIHARCKFLRIVRLDDPPATDGVTLLYEEVYLVVSGYRHFVEVLLIDLLQVKFILGLAWVWLSVHWKFLGIGRLKRRRVAFILKLEFVDLQVVDKRKWVLNPWLLHGFESLEFRMNFWLDKPWDILRPFYIL